MYVILRRVHGEGSQVQASVGILRSFGVFAPSNDVTLRRVDAEGSQDATLSHFEMLRSAQHDGDVISAPTAGLQFPCSG